MQDLYFEKKYSFTKDETLSFFKGYKKAEQKLLINAGSFYIGLFFIGWLLVDLGLSFIAVFLGFVVACFGFTIKIMKIGQNLEHNEKIIIKNITPEIIISIVEEDLIHHDHKKMILGLIPKRKLNFAMKFANSRATQTFILSVSETLNDSSFFR